MKPDPEPDRTELHARIASLISAADSAESRRRTRDALLDDILHYQEVRVPPYGRLRDSRPTVLGLPTDVFRFARVASFEPKQDTRIFRTSGTTSGQRGEHVFRDLSLYDLAAKTAAKAMLFPDVESLRFVILAPSSKEAPDSSLSYMLDRFVTWFGTELRRVWPLEGPAFTETLSEVFSEAERAQQPVAVLGTSFAFVHADDALGKRRFRLPAGSRIMQTGGFKGRSRELSPDGMRHMLQARLSVVGSHIVSEYGMTELSSQMYETSLVDALAGVTRKRHYWTPWWMRATAVHPETLGMVPLGETGILRLDDAANLDSVAFLQTADRARVQGDGFVLLGRDRSAVPRGCSLAVEEALRK